jgi:hypothetical protein
MPRALYAQADAYARLRHLTMSELLIDALQLRLDTPVDPRDIVQSQDKDVMAKVQAMVDAAVQAALAQRGTPQAHTEPPAATPALDVKKYTLRPLCKRGHEYGNTGQSLCTASGHCVECAREARERYNAKEKRS